MLHSCLPVVLFEVVRYGRRGLRHRMYEYDAGFRCLALYLRPRSQYGLPLDVPPLLSVLLRWGRINH